MLAEGAQEMLGLEGFRQMFEQTAGVGFFPLAAALPAHHGSNGAAIGASAGFPAHDEPLSVAGLPRALEQRYGAASGRGLALRIGRSAFKYLLQRRGDTMGLNSVDFRFQRAPLRMKTGLHLLAQELIKDSGDRITISEDAAYWVWRSERCPVCWGRETGEASCYLTVGLIQEFLAWAGSGRYYRVIETECRAAGAAACTFRIDQKPLD